MQASLKPSSKFAPASPRSGKGKKKANEITAEQLQEIREAFNLFDTDNSGALRAVSAHAASCDGGAQCIMHA